MKASRQNITQNRGISSKKRENSPARQDFTEGPSPTPDHKKPKRRKKDFRIDIYKAWCKACGICVAFCPARVFAKEEEGYPQVARPEACIGCGWCEIHCPDFAITVREKETREKEK